jgi:hypothetical protein
MIGLDIQVKHHSALSELQKRIGAPLVEIASIVLQRVHARTLGGMGPVGKLAPLGAYSKSNGVPFWVGPDKPQPAGEMYKVKPDAKRFAGFAVYRDYATYAALHGTSRDLTETGEAWSKAAVRLQSPTRATAAFYGTHKSGKGRAPTGAIMHAGVRHEPVPLFRLNDEDRRVIREMVLSRLTADMVNASAQAGQIFKASQKATALGKRYSKLMAGRR